MKILFVGNMWFGSDARGFRDALHRHADVTLDEFNLDPAIPVTTRKPLRYIYRLIRGFQIKALEADLMDRIKATNPDVVLVFKGNGVLPAFVDRVKAMGVPTVNLFPDYSPRAYGPVIQEVMGHYDLVISTKAHHPARWHEVYGYSNPCVHVGHGYGPDVHLCDQPASDQDYDVVMIATWRAEYERLVKRLAEKLAGRSLKVAIGGFNWDRSSGLPSDWEFIGPQLGRAYTDWLRRGKVVVAPVQLTYMHQGQEVPADQVTARSFQCPAAHTFFIHPRTDEAQVLFDEATEVPMFSDPDELADKVLHYLDRPEERAQMAAAAHAKAVPAMGQDARAQEIVAHLQTLTGRG